MKIIHAGILIILILTAGCIEPGNNKDIKDFENRTSDKVSVEPAVTEISNEPGIENKTVKVDYIKTNKSEINNSIDSLSENFTGNITENDSSNKSNFTLKPQIKKIKFDIYGLHYNRDAQEIESKLQYDLAGIIYARTSFADDCGEVVYDSVRIKKDTIIKEAGVLKSPGGIFVKEFRITVTEEINCTKSNNEYICCGDSGCRVYRAVK